MKKCASCIKDLPDAALHCVFCGAKQAPAPAVQQGLAKTAFGYAASDVAQAVLDQVRQNRAQAPAPAASSPRTVPAPVPPMPARVAGPAAPGPPPSASPPAAPPSVAAPPVARPVAGPPPAAPPYAAGPQGGVAPASAASAKTMFVPAAAPASAAAGFPSGPSPSSLGATAPTVVSPPVSPVVPSVVPPAKPIAMAVPAKPPSPIMAIPAAQPPPYLASQTASRAIRPVDPWQDSLRAMMFLWGVALLAAFATPLATSPALVFHWTGLLDGADLARVAPLVLAAVGALSVIVAFIPMPTAPRGLIAAVLALGGIAVPIAQAGLPPWQQLTQMVGVLVLVPSLLVRGEYRDAAISRVFVTLGALGILLPELVPQDGAIPLVGVFKQLIDLPGSEKVAPALTLGLVTVAVMSLLAWLPAPVTGAAKLWAWLVILWALLVHVARVALQGNFVDAITGAPNATLVSWVAGGGAAALGSAYLVLVGYGLASVLGKQLE